MKARPHSPSGFMLLEIIATLVITALLGAVVFQYLGSSLIENASSAVRQRKSLELREIAEKISADYKVNHKEDLPALQTRIGETGTSQDNEHYGKYTVVENKYIVFKDQKEADAGEEDEKDKLKVTIKNEQKETITILFISS